MKTSCKVKLIVASLSATFMIVGCNGGGNTPNQSPAANTPTQSAANSSLQAQLLGAEQKVSMINDNSTAPFAFSSNGIGKSDSHSMKFINTSGHRIMKTVIKIDNPNFTIQGGFVKFPGSTDYSSTNLLADNGSIDFNLVYTGSSVMETAATTTLTVEYTYINDNGTMSSTPGIATFPIQYQTTNGPAVINPSTSSIQFREVLANGNDFDSYLLNLTNDSDTPSGNISFAPSSSQFSIEKTDCTSLAPHASCSVKVDFGKSVQTEEFDITNPNRNNNYAKAKHPANLEIKYFAENSNTTAKTATIALGGSIVPADKVYVKLESAVAGSNGKLFAGDGTTATPFNTEIGGKPLSLTLTYKNTGTFAVENLNLDTSKISSGYTVASNDCANVSLPTNGTCNITLNAATKKVGAENLDLATIPVTYAGHTATTVPYAGSNIINMNVHPKSTWLLETYYQGPSGVHSDYDSRVSGPTRYFDHDDLIKIYVTATNPDSKLVDLQIDPKSLPKGMQCVGGDDEHNNPCKAIMTQQAPGIVNPEHLQYQWLGLIMDRSVPGAIYHIKGTSQGHPVAADVMITGWWQVGNAPANTEITGIAAYNNNVYATAANNSRVFYNNGVINPRGSHNWSATKGVANMSKLAIDNGNLCLVANGKDLYSTTDITKGVQGLTKNFSLDNISNIACMSSGAKSLASSGNSVYYADGGQPKVLASALKDISSLVANDSKVYFADNTKAYYSVANSYSANSATPHAIPQTDTDIQGQQYWPNYSWLLSLSTDKTKLFVNALNKTKDNAPQLYPNNVSDYLSAKDPDWIYGSYYYRTSDDGATWNKDTRLGQSWALLFPNMLPSETVASDDFVWTNSVTKLTGKDSKIIAPNGPLSQCGFKLKPDPFAAKDHDNHCIMVDTPLLHSDASDISHINPSQNPTNYGFNHIAYDPTYNMMYYSDNAGNVFGVWGQVQYDKYPPYPNSPSYK